METMYGHRALNDKKLKYVAVTDYLSNIAKLNSVSVTFNCRQNG